MYEFDSEVGSRQERKRWSSYTSLWQRQIQRRGKNVRGGLAVRHVIEVQKRLKTGIIRKTLDDKIKRPVRMVKRPSFSVMGYCNPHYILKALYLKNIERVRIGFTFEVYSGKFSNLDLKKIIFPI